MINEILFILTLVIEKMEARISWYFSTCFLGPIIMASRKGIWHVILYPRTFVEDTNIDKHNDNGETFLKVIPALRIHVISVFLPWDTYVEARSCACFIVDLWPNFGCALSLMKSNPKPP